MRNHLRFFCLIFLITLQACTGDEGDLVRRTQYIMGTLVEINVRGTDEEQARQAIGAAFDEMSRLESLMSTHRADSDISRLNRAAGGGFISVSPEVLEVVRRGIDWGERSGGALDITIGPVVKLWDFDEERKQVPQPDVLSHAVGLVGFRNLQIKDGKIRLARKGMAIHLGSIAKGYAVDRAVAVLKGNNIDHALVNAGGDLMTIGTREENRPWRIGIQHPRQPQEILASFALSGRAVATSGDYQKYFIRDNIRYHHIFDPADGMPAPDTISATILADTVMDADALATAVFVLGPEKGMNLIDSTDGVESMIVSKTGETRTSSGFRSQPEFTLREKESIAP